MKPGLVDRLLTMCLCHDLVVLFWDLSLHYAYHHRMFAVVL